MKKTLTVNLNNIVFHIDDDAYEVLQTYLHDIAEHFQSEDEKQEIMNDIEARIAELFTEKLQKNKNVVNLEDVQEVIEVMGKPSQYTDEEEEEAAGPKVEREKKTFKSKRFYRDPENAVLGGVGSGLAAYFNMDVTLVRILLVVLALVGGSIVIPLYLVAWLVAPQALTASQRLEMQGESVTVESIKTELNNAKNYVESDKFKKSASSVGARLGEIFRWLLKIALGLVGALLGVVGVVAVGSLLVVLFVMIFNPAFFSGFAPELISNWALLTPEKMILLIVSLILLVGCPVFLIVYWAIQIVSGRRNSSKTASWVVLILWLAGLFMFFSIGANTIFNLRAQDGNHFTLTWSDRRSPEMSEQRTVEPFNGINVSGNIEVVLVKDSVRELTVEAEKNHLPQIVTEVREGVLHIYSDVIFLNSTVRVTVPVDSLSGIDCSGASRVDTEGQLSSGTLKLKLSGASRVNLNVQVADLVDVDVSGASQTDITGSANSVKVEGSGASQVRAQELTAKSAFVKVTGASHAGVNATERLDATATGAGEVNCTGSPKLVNKISHVGSSIHVE